MSETPMVEDEFSRDELIRDVIFCVNTAAQLFHRQTPEPAWLIVWHPSGEDGWIAGEVEGLDIPVRTITRKAADLAPDLSRAEASIVMVRLARLATTNRGGPNAH